MFAASVLIKAMYQFAIDMGEENSYTRAAPQGVEAKIFENLAASESWYLVLGIWYLGPFATLCRPDS
jgi:hypothetical protein